VTAAPRALGPCSLRPHLHASSGVLPARSRGGTRGRAGAMGRRRRRRPPRWSPWMAAAGLGEQERGEGGASGSHRIGDGGEIPSIEGMEMSF
jgi:hypothetical protein